MNSRNYPKHWDGYNSLGGKMARQLDAVGLPYLKKSTHDGTLTRKHDNMYTVTGGVDDEYLSIGNIRKNATTRNVSVMSPDYRRGFVKKSAFFGTYVGKGKGISLVLSQRDAKRSSVFHYYASVPDPRKRVTRLIHTNNPDPIAVSGNIRSRRASGFATPFSIVFPDEAGGITYRPTAPLLIPLRHRPDKTLDYMVVSSVTDQSADLFGAPVNSIFYAKINSADETVNFFLLPQSGIPDPAIRSSHMLPEMITVGPGQVFLFSLTEWGYPRADGPALFPVARIMYTANGGDTWATVNTTDIMLDDMPWVPTTIAEQRDHLVFSMAWFRALNMIWRTANMVAIGNGEALLTFVYPKRQAEAPTLASGELGFRVYLLSSTGVRRISEDVAPGAEFYYYQDMAYVGQNTVLAKKTYGYPGINRNVEWVVSYYRGYTWTTVAAAGLPNLPPNRKNQFFGNLTVIEAISDRYPNGLVILPAYDPEELAYFVYESADLGASWERRGVLSRTEQFFRVDQMLYDDGGGNFQRVQYIGSRAEPALYNPAIPDLLGPP